MKTATLTAPRGAAVQPAAATLRAAVRKNFPKRFGRFGRKHYFCSAYHTNQAAMSPTAPAVGLFYGHGGNKHLFGSVPCGALMRPQPDSGGKQRGAEPFLFLRQSTYCFIKLLTTMKTATMLTAPRGAAVQSAAATLRAAVLNLFHATFSPRVCMAVSAIGAVAGFAMAALDQAAGLAAAIGLTMPWLAVALTRISKEVGAL